MDGKEVDSMSDNTASGQGRGPLVRHIPLDVWYARQVGIPWVNAPGMLRPRVKAGKRLHRILVLWFADQHKEAVVSARRESDGLIQAVVHEQSAEDCDRDWKLDWMPEVEYDRAIARRWALAFRVDVIAGDEAYGPVEQHVARSREQGVGGQSPGPNALRPRRLSSVIFPLASVPQHRKPPPLNRSAHNSPFRRTSMTEK